MAKYTPAGALSYVTYLGGKGDDAGAAIAVDANGNAYVTGFTSSSDFPATRGAYQATYGGRAEAANISLESQGLSAMRSSPS